VRVVGAFAVARIVVAGADVRGVGALAVARIVVAGADLRVAVVVVVVVIVEPDLRAVVVGSDRRPDRRPELLSVPLPPEAVGAVPALEAVGVLSGLEPIGVPPLSGTTPPAGASG